MHAHQLPQALGHGVADKRIDILRAIGRSGSISQAAREVGVSYKAAWQALETLTNLAGVPLVERVVGGVGGGGALLTAQGQQLLELATALDEARQQVQARWAAAQGAVAGEGVPAQAAYARLALRTSMRNQLPARLGPLMPGGRTLQVPLQLGDGDPGARLSARITHESAELLGLQEGLAVVVLCKATAVRVSRGRPAGAALANVLAGQVTAVAPDDQGDEIVLSLGPGLQLVGFAAPQVDLQPGQAAWATLDSTALVLALPG